MTVAPGSLLNVDSLSFATTSNAPAGSGSMFPVVEYSTNPAFSSPETMGSFTVNGPDTSWVVDTASANPIADGTGTYYFRIYNTSNLPDYYGWNLDDVDLNGSVTSVPEPASVGLPIISGATLLMRRRKRSKGR